MRVRVRVALGVERGFGQPESRRLSLRCRASARDAEPKDTRTGVYSPSDLKVRMVGFTVVGIASNTAAEAENQSLGNIYKPDCQTAAHSQGAIRASRLPMAYTLGVLEVPVDGQVPLRAAAEAPYRRVPVKWCAQCKWQLSLPFLCGAWLVSGASSFGEGCNTKWRW